MPTTTVYPGSLDGFAAVEDDHKNPSTGGLIRGTPWAKDPVGAWVAALNAIETTLGVNPQGSYESVAARLTDWAAGAHTHTNKTLLDSYTQTNANLADAVTKKHSANTDSVAAGWTGYSNYSTNPNPINVGSPSVTGRSINVGSTGTVAGVTIQNTTDDNTTSKSASVVTLARCDNHYLKTWFMGAHGNEASGYNGYQAFLIQEATDNGYTAFVDPTSALGWAWGHYNGSSWVTDALVGFNGHMGLARTALSNSGTAYGSIETAYSTLLMTTGLTGNIALCFNSYYSGSTNKYLNTGTANRLTVNKDALAYAYAASGSAGADVSFSTRFYIDNATGKTWMYNYGSGGSTHPVTIYYNDAQFASLQMCNSTSGSTTTDGFVVGLTGAQVGMICNYEGMLSLQASATSCLDITSTGAKFFGGLGIGGDPSPTAYQLHVGTTATNNASSKYVANFLATHTISTSGTYYVRGNNTQVNAVVTTGATNSGYSIGMWTQCCRNSYTAGQDDAGTLALLQGYRISYGHLNTNTSTSPTTTTAYGLNVVSYRLTGTIVTDCMIYASTSGGSGTATNSYGLYITGVSGTSLSYDIYLADAGANNYIAGKLQVASATNWGNYKASIYSANYALACWGEDVIFGLASSTATTGKEYLLQSLGIGDFRIYDATSSATRFRIRTGGNIQLYVPTAAPADDASNWTNNMVTFWIDEANNRLYAKVKKSDGTYKSGYISLS